MPSRFQKWAEQQWAGRHTRKPPWSTAEWVCLQRGRDKLGNELAARASWTNYLEEESDFYRSHSPRKWIHDLARWTVAPPKSEWATHSDLNPQRGEASPAMQRRRELMLEAKARGDKDPRLSSLAAWRAEGWEEKTRSGNEQAKG